MTKSLPKHWLPFIFVQWHKQFPCVFFKHPMPLAALRTLHLSSLLVVFFSYCQVSLAFVFHAISMTVAHHWIYVAFRSLLPAFSCYHFFFFLIALTSVCERFTYFLLLIATPFPPESQVHVSHRVLYAQGEEEWLAVVTPSFYWGEKKRYEWIREGTKEGRQELYV